MNDELLHDHDHDHDDDLIILTDENGAEVKFEFLDLIDHGDEEYVVLLPFGESEEEANEEAEVVILRVETTMDGEESFVGIEEEAELHTIFGLFQERWKDHMIEEGIEEDEEE